MVDETGIRLSVFRWIQEQEKWNNGIFSGRELNEGIVVDNRKITLKGQNGIWFPKDFSIPISITTSLRGGYHLDDPDDDGFLVYSYRGQDPMHRDNVGLREAWRTRTPLVYFLEVREYHYQAIWPVIILEDHTEKLFVRASIDPAYAELKNGTVFSDIGTSPLDLRRYAWGQTRRRLHQSAFRDLVVSAYSERCAICRLNHPELLDAAHIVPDSDDRGLPVVPNGLSLCKIHHAAYDQNILGIDEDYHIHVREDILAERDGPMLKHGIQEVNGASLILPTHLHDHPDRDRLAERFSQFQSA